MASPCKQYGCPNHVTNKGQRGYCDDHADQRVTSNWQKRTYEAGSTTKRGYGSVWVKLRKVILERDKHLCQACKRNGLAKRGWHVDHIISKAKGGTDEQTNLQTLCEPCHNSKTAMENR